MRYITKIVQPSSSAGGVTSVAGRTGSVTLIKTDVGLGNVDNTSDINKPVSTATQTVLDSKAPVASPLFTGTPAAPTAATGTNTNQLATTAFVQASVAGLDTSGTSAADIGLGNVDNTSDANKPVSTATQTALDSKAPVASPLFTGTPAAPTATTGTNTNQLATTAFVQASIAGLNTSGGGVSGVDVGSFYYFDKDATAPDKYISFTQQVLLDPALYPELANVIPVSSGSLRSLQATLNNPAPADYDYFGYSVSISGDYAIVGAYWNDTGADSAGSAYIYVRSGTTWSLQATLNNPAPADYDRFGNSVSISGDYAIVGAFADDTSATEAGSAHIYVRSGTTWSLQSTLNNPAPAANDLFGYSVAISGDYAIVGAYYDDTGVENAGSAYIYVRSGTTWSLQATLNNPDPAAYDWFGCSVAISSDYVIVGAPYDDTGATDAGSAYIYVRSGTTWSLQATLNNPTPAAYDWFGRDVSISGDYAIVGAYGDDTGAGDAGSAYIYARSGTTWSLQSTLNNPTPIGGDIFGASVAISGDYAIVGAFYEDTGANAAGSAYIYGSSPSNKIVLNPLPSSTEHKTIVRVKP